LIEREVTITNKEGLHARPAALLVREASRFDSDVFLSADSREVNAKSVLGVMSLAAITGTVIRIRAQGHDQEEAVAALTRLVEEGFRNAY
jgi:phosphotransferase system HPr (HPr) family protein